MKPTNRDFKMLSPEPLRKVENQISYIAWYVVITRQSTTSWKICPKHVESESIQALKVTDIIKKHSDNVEHEALKRGADLSLLNKSMAKRGKGEQKNILDQKD